MNTKTTIMKKIIGTIACFTIFTLIFGLLGISIEDSFAKGIKIGLFVDVIAIGIIGIAMIVEWMFNDKIK